jgi:hypothetical protein
MADRSSHRLRWALVATCVLASCASGTGPAPTVGALQFNLCDSGIAGCFTGRSVSMAAAVIRHDRPDVVTLNEVCRSDVAALARAMAAAQPDERVASAFQAARDRTTGGPYRCVNGQSYGIGVLVRVGAASHHRTFSGVYPTQDLTDTEERVWLCIDVPSDVLACTTHTASTSTAVALAQCRYFLGSAVPAIRGHVGNVPVVLGADLNLRADHSPSPQSCLSRGYHRDDDGALQDVITSQDVSLRSRDVINMRGTTDHPGLLVELTLP